MSAITGESLFYEVTRVLKGRHALSYYQFKALSSLIELITLHDRAALIVGEETDSEYLAAFNWLIDLIHEKSDFKIDLVFPKHRTDYITQDVMSRFEEICSEIYPYPLGLTSSDLFSKQSKDRTSEDMSEFIEQIFAKNYPDLDVKSFAQDIYDLSLSNANSSELLYFFRAHLFQAIAERQGVTPIFENQRLISSVLQQEIRIENKIGSLPYTIYKMVDNLFVERSQVFNQNPHSSPRASIFLNDILSKAASREEILEYAFTLRNELSAFRSFYKTTEAVLGDPNKSLSTRSAKLDQLQSIVNRVWVPTIATLGTNRNYGMIPTVIKRVFGKYGVGEVKFERSTKDTANEDSLSYSTSLLGIGTALAQTVSEMYKDSTLATPNKPLLEILLRVIHLKDTSDKLKTLLPVRDFDYSANRLLDIRLAKTMIEVYP